MRATVLLVALSIAVTSCGGRGGQSVEEPRAAVKFRNTSQPVNFVGDDACFDCHESYYTGYKAQGMAKSYYPLSAANRVEDVRSVLVVDRRSGLRYTVVDREDGLYQEEFLLDDAGRKIDSLARRMDYVVGSGSAARTYLSEENGRLYELPLTWYTQKKKWDFSPGYEIANFRFNRLVPDRCMACHNGFPKSVPFVEGKYIEVPNGIGCERCHGPGALHVRERLEVPEPPSDVDDSIVNPAHLSFALRMDVCQQCHLHTTVSLLREGRDPFGFRPGQPLEDQIALFAEEDPSKEAGVDVISHADRMKQSACFLGTMGTPRALECTTCHDPHADFRELGRDNFNNTCIGCHAVDSLSGRLRDLPAASMHSETSDCFGCHMPRVEVEDAPHSSFTDHLIRVVGRNVVSSPVPAHDKVELRPYFDRDAEGESGAVYHAMALIVYGRQMNRPATIRDGVTALTTLLASDTTRSEAMFLLGLGHQLVGDHSLSLKPLESAVRMEPDNPDRLNGLAQAYELAGVNKAVAGRLYRRALAIQPAAAQIRVNYGRYLQSQGLVDQAIQEYLKATKEDDRLDVAYYNLGTAYVAQGEFSSAEGAFRDAIRLNPLYIDAIGNLASVLAARGREAEAGKLFERAVEVAPDDPTALGNLGAFRLNEGADAEAVTLLRRAITANPLFVDAIANLALAYFRLDDPDTAREFAGRALELDPANKLARQVAAATE